MCNRNEYFLFKLVIADFSSGYLSVYSSLSAFSIPVRDRNSCTFCSNCLFSFTENLPNLIVTPRVWVGRKMTYCQYEKKQTSCLVFSHDNTVVHQLLPAGEEPLLRHLTSPLPGHTGEVGFPSVFSSSHTLFPKPSLVIPFQSDLF